MRKSSIVLIALLVAALMVSGLFNIKLFKENQDLKKALPYLFKSESVEYFDLIDTSGANITLSDLESQNALVLIFSQPCNICNKNIDLWNKIASLVKGQCEVYGIIPGDAGYSTDIEKKVKFKLYYPADRKQFSDVFRLRMNLPQTIIYSQNKVIYIKLGELTGTDFTEIVRALRNPENKKGVS
ncbi:MAG: redoxin domain-containing protein [bacterium]|nr:redoxin domain-containing protein [bacterium]